MAKRGNKGKGGDEDGYVNLKEDIQTYIKEAVDSVVVNLLKEITELKEKVQYLTINNADLVKTLKDCRNVCQNCLFNKEDSENVLNSSQSSASSSDTVINKKNSHTYAQKAIHLKKSNTDGHIVNVNNKIFKSAVNINNAGEGNRKNIIVGTNSNNDTDPANAFEAPAPKLWLYVGRCKADTTEAKVMSYLNSKVPKTTFQVSKLETKGVNSSFRVATDWSLYDQLYEPSFWPKGVLVKKFVFRRLKDNTQGDFL